MSILKKIFVLTYLILSIIILISTVISYQSSVRLSFKLIPFSEYPIIGTMLPVIIFYLSIIFLFFALVSFFTVLFFPQKTISFFFMKSSGLLTVNKKAIEGLVNEVILNKQVIIEPMITVKMRKTKISITVRGNLSYFRDVFSKIEDCTKEIERELHQLIGEEVNINFKIKFTEYRNKSQGRVN